MIAMTLIFWLITTPVLGEMLPITGKFCSFGKDAQGFDVYPFKITAAGYSDQKAICDVVCYKHVGDGWLRVKDTCEYGMDIKVLGDTMLANFDDKHEYILRRCD